MKMGPFCKLYRMLILGKLKVNKLTEEQQQLTAMNIRKHLAVLWLMIFTMVFTYYMITNYYMDNIDTVISSLLGVLFISGNAWYAVSFGAIPVKFMDFAVNITAYLFTALAISMSAVLVAASIAVPLLSPILIIAFFVLYKASVQYDIVDALKLGIDEVVFEHAKVGRVYFTRELKRKK